MRAPQSFRVPAKKIDACVTAATPLVSLPFETLFRLVACARNARGAIRDSERR